MNTGGINRQLLLRLLRKWVAAGLQNRFCVPDNPFVHSAPPHVPDCKINVIGDPPEFHPAIFDNRVSRPRVAIARLSHAAGIDDSTTLDLQVQWNVRVSDADKIPR